MIGLGMTWYQLKIMQRTWPTIDLLTTNVRIICHEALTDYPFNNQ